MAKRSASRKSRKHTSHKKHHSRKHHRRHTRKRGGEYALKGAPVTYSLSGDWSSRMSLGQGEDYFKYHEGQHGGVAPYPASVEVSQLPVDMRGPAMVSGTMQSYADVAGLRDPPFDQMPVQQGGRKHRRHSKAKKRHTRRRRGGALGYAPLSAPAMLLPNQRAYSQAGLNPDYRGAAVEYSMAKARNAV